MTTHLRVVVEKNTDDPGKCGACHLAGYWWDAAEYACALWRESVKGDKRLEQCKAAEAAPALSRPSDIVDARIEGLQEGAKIAQAEFFMKHEGFGYNSVERPCFDDVGPALDARIAELEATAPEVQKEKL